MTEAPGASRSEKFIRVLLLVLLLGLGILVSSRPDWQAALTPQEFTFGNAALGEPGVYRGATDSDLAPNHLIELRQRGQSQAY